MTPAMALFYYWIPIYTLAGMVALIWVYLIWVPVSLERCWWKAFLLIPLFLTAVGIVLWLLVTTTQFVEKFSPGLAILLFSFGWAALIALAVAGSTDS